MMKTEIQDEIERMTAQIVVKYAPEKIILFGSCARGESEAGSDVDILVIKKDTPLYGADRIRELSRLIERSVPVDFLVYRPEEFDRRLALGDPFVAAIVAEGKVLYG